MDTRYKLGERVLVVIDGVETLRTISSCTVTLDASVGAKTDYNGGEFDDYQIMGTVTVTPPKVKRTRRKRRTTAQMLTASQDIFSNVNGEVIHD